MSEWIEISEEEREGMLQSLRENIDEYPIIPTFKQEEAIEYSLEHGNMDFIAFTLGYQGEASGGGRATVHPTKPWSYATTGYSIVAESIQEALAVVLEIVEREKGRHMFIYFRVEAPDMTRPLNSCVDISMEIREETERQLMAGNRIRWEYYDI